MIYLKLIQQISLVAVIILSTACAGTTTDGATTDDDTTVALSSVLLDQTNEASELPLLIKSVSPAPGETQVALNLDKIVVNFDKEIDPNSLNLSSFTVGNGLTGTISVSNTGKTANFIPDNPLSRGTTYTASLEGITDISGNILKTNNGDIYNWSFSTCGDVATSTYTLSWDAVIDNDLSGYRVYYSTEPLTKAAPFQDVGNVLNWKFKPNDLGLQPCTTIYAAVSALGGNRSQSGLSNQVSTVIL